MAPSNKIWTLQDVTNGSPSTSPDDEIKNPSKATADTANNPNPNPLAAAYCQPAKPGVVTGGDCSIPKLCHIPNLPHSDVCEATLKRIQQEFGPIVKLRGYRVLSVSEMCCCGDGLDHAGSRRRKLRKQSANVWGYNMTRFGRPKTHTIHLRLRDPRDHTRL
jgi:hypothetical protein